MSAETNPVVALMPTFLRSLAIVASDPALGYRGAAIMSALNFAATATERGIDARNEFAELTEMIRKQAESGTEAPKSTWYDFKARHDAAEMLFNPPPPEASPGGEPILDAEDEK